MWGTCPTIKSLPRTLPGPLERMVERLVRPILTWSSLTLYSLAIIMMILITAPLGQSQPLERALTGQATGYLSSTITGIEVCIDSGCTTTSIPEEIASLFPVTKVLEEKPDRKLFIADDRGLPITKVISTRLPVSGYTISSRGSEALESTSLPVSRALVVKGMKKNMILVSTRGMKRDGINTYLNDDNSIKRSDCLYVIESKIVIPFVPSNHSYNIHIESSNDAASYGAPYNKTLRPARLVHSGLGHVGRKRINASKLIMDGVELKHVEHDEGTCKGCRLGNTGKAFNKHRGTRLSKHGDSTQGFAHFGQQMEF